MPLITSGGVALSDPWLDLLLSGGSSGDVLRMREQLLGGVTDEDERSLITASADQAVRLATALGERTQRASELASLYDLAIRLTAVRDLDALLQEVVTQAKRLLHVDLAYLALREADGGLHIRVTEGSVGPSLRGTKLSSTGGLAGRVSVTGEPFWTSDYVNEARFEHRVDVDQVATNESLASLLGVPLRRGGDVIGVLLAAERDHRPFSAAEVSLLSSLAAIAGVAIDNAQLFSQLEATNRQMREAAERTSRAVHHHDRLMAVASRGGEVAEVIEGLAEFIDGAVVFEPGDGVESKDVDSHEGAAHVTTVPVATGQQGLGRLRLTSAHAPDETDLRLLERSALTIAMLLSTRQALSEAEWRTADEVLATLLSGATTDPDVLLRRTAAAGLDVNRPCSVAVLTAPPAALNATLRRAKDFAGGNSTDASGGRGGLAGRFNGSVVLITPRPTADIVAAWRDVAGVTSPDARSTCGVAGPATGQAALGAAHRDAERTARALEALGRAGEISSPGELGPYRFLLSRAGRDDAAVFIRAQLGALLAQDRERGTELVPTLHEFLASGRQHTATARAMSIHTNTLYQRLDRITGILGEDWREPARAFDLQMALTMHRLMEQHSVSAH